MTDDRKSCIMNGEQAREVDHLLTRDVNMWRDVLQSLRQSYVLLTFLYVKRAFKNRELEHVINRLSHGVWLSPSVSSLDHYQPLSH